MTRRRASAALRRRVADHSERRRRIRFRATLPVRIHTDGMEIQGQTRNVSLLGVSAIAERPAVQGTAATAELDLPGTSGPPIRISEGSIVRSIPLNLPGEPQYEVGVFALKYHGQDEARLSQYLEQLQMAEYAAVRAGYKALREKIRLREQRKRALLLAKRRRRKLRLAKRRRRALAAARRKAAAAARRRAKARSRHHS